MALPADSQSPTTYYASDHVHAAQSQHSKNPCNPGSLHHNVAPPAQARPGSHTLGQSCPSQQDSFILILVLPTFRDPRSPPYSTKSKMPGGIHVPVEVILAWPKANTVNPETRPNTIFVLACILGPLTVSMLFTRLWVRVFLQRAAGWDDWLILAGTIPTIALTIVWPLAVNNAFNRHIWDLEPYAHPDEMVVARKYILSILCVFCVASGFIKVSILLFYRRLSSRVVSNAFRWTTWLTIAFIVAYTIALTLAPIFGCDPFSAFWDQANVTKLLQGYTYRCFDEGADVFAASVISAFQDLITAILPSFLFWDLHIPIRQKVALFSIFALGYGVVALGAVRAYYSWQIYYETYDVTWVTWNMFLVSLLELHVGCFCANAPTFKVFFRHFFAEKLSSSLKRSNESGQKNSDQSNGSKPERYTDSTVDKMSFFFSKGSSGSGFGSVDNNGYISDLNTEVSVDAYGDILVHKASHMENEHGARLVSPSPHLAMRQSTDTADLFIGRHYDDIEMGHFATRHNSQASSFFSSNFHSSRIHEEDEGVEALPRMPGSPKSTTVFSSERPAPSSPRTMETSRSYKHHPLSPARTAFARSPTPAITFEANNLGKTWRNSCPTPRRIPS